MANQSLPEQFLGDDQGKQEYSSDYLEALRRAIKEICPQDKRHGQKPTFVYKELATTPNVFVRHDAQWSECVIFQSFVYNFHIFQ